MAGQLRLRRGTTSQLANYNGSEGELTYNTTLKSLVLHDGETAGGVKIPYLSNDLIPSTMLPTATESVIGASKIATTAIAQAGTNDTDFLTAKKLRDALNASGVLPIYGLRSWGIIKGTTTPASLGRGVNVASIVDEGVGQYKVTFITAMPNIDYVILTGTTSYSTGDLGAYGAVKMGSKTVNGFSIVCGAQNYVDVPEIYFGVTY